MQHNVFGIVVYFLTAVSCERNWVNFVKNEDLWQDKLGESHCLEDSLDVKDVLPYSRSLKLLLDYLLKYPNEIDMNMAFSLSVAHDNLKHVLVNKGYKLPDELREYVITFLDTDRKLLQYFESMVNGDNSKSVSRTKRISTLFLNRTLGLRGISEFNKRRKSPLNLYRSTHYAWKKYEDKLTQFERYRPNPTDNERCLASLARNNQKKLQCTITYTCNDMLANGTNFGYPLVYRLHWLLHARRGRGCYILSPRGDKELMDEFCQNIFYEASYIAANRYGKLSLLLEQITLCSLAGYADILRRSWMLEMLKHQTPFGCFSSKLAARKRLPDGYTDSPHQWTIHASTCMLGGICNRHVTAAAIGALSSALRYVLEERSFAHYIQD